MEPDIIHSGLEASPQTQAELLSRLGSQLELSRVDHPPLSAVMSGSLRGCMAVRPQIVYNAALAQDKR